MKLPCSPNCGCAPANERPALDLVAVRAKLASSAGGGKKYWRSLEAVAETPEFHEWLHREYPRGASEWPEGRSRRDFLKLMAASFALAGVTACTRQPQEKILPYVKQPEQLVPGIPLQYATAMTIGGYATGLLVESHEGRPTKIEGNPDHSMSLGAANVFHQASILELYDPERTRTVLRAGEVSSWDEFMADLVNALAEQRPKQGAGMRILTETVTSPTLAAQIDTLLKKYPQAKWHRYEPWNRDSERAANHSPSQVKPGEPVEMDEDQDAHHRFDKARVVVALDADFLFTHPASLQYARQFANARRAVTQGGVIGSLDPAIPRVAELAPSVMELLTAGSEPRRPVDPDHAEMNRLYVAEPTPTVTGSMADHRLPAAAREMAALARAILDGVRSVQPLDPSLPPAIRRWLETAVRDLRHSRGASIVIAGEGQPAEVHAMVQEINAHLGNEFVVTRAPTVESWTGRIYDDRVQNEARPIKSAQPAEEEIARQVAATQQLTSLRELAADMHADRVELLFVLGGNPAYNAPADFDFASAMGKVRRCVQLGLFYDETAQRCQWHLPQAHYLESWGDARAIDGTASIIQPLILPLYEGRTAHELLEILLTEQTARGAYDIVRGTWEKRHGAEYNAAGGFEKFWRKVVHNGLEPRLEKVQSSILQINGALRRIDDPAPDANVLEIVFKPDYTVWDGRFCNSGWLQETPKPITKLTWDNAALLSPRLAEKLGVVNEDVVELTFKGRSVHAPVWIQPGQAENSVTLHLGYGRTAGGSVGSGQGVNAYALRTSEAMGFGVGLEIKKVPGVKWELACAQNHHSTEGRDIYRTGTLEEYRKKPSLAPENTEVPGRDDTLYPPDHTYPGHAWGMAIDLSTCIGCNACMVACQAENNIPIVGKGEVIKGREMHWIRVDGYYEGEMDNPAMYHQPVPCMHCENAPCEVVCPVAATLHSPEGLNEQVYNRCIGTRYCSNNCPYKVRRFNFVQYADNEHLTIKMQRNPDVTVRSRGVMEKCTFCVQRINEVKITAEKENRPVRDGEIKTACQQTCPTEAIVFGDINDPGSRVSRLKEQERNFGMFADLNTRPRTTYLARITNPLT